MRIPQKARGSLEEQDIHLEPIQVAYVRIEYGLSTMCTSGRGCSKVARGV